jgi:photosystem II stability/assembly factor-like uncharacterized protein
MKKLICFSILFMVANATFAQAGWRWQNPYLQGNDLNSIVMNGVEGWAVGDLGTVMRTANSGYDWEIVDIGTTENLNCIYMSGVTGRGWIVGNNGAIYYSDNDGESWSKQYSGTHEILYSVTGWIGECIWICGNDIILKSHNYGENWERINSGSHSRFFEIDQTDCGEIWIAGEHGLVISSLDAGLTWQSHPTPTTYSLFSISTLGNGDYRACGQQGVIIGSSDGGNTWVKEYEETFLDLHDIEIKGLAAPSFAVGINGTILETYDGGESWTRKESGTINMLNDICDQALYHAIYATGWYGIILRKEEPQGAEFEILNKRPLHYIQSVDFVDADTGWAVGGAKVELSGTIEGIVLHTTDGGATWEEQLNIPKALNSIDFINENEGWAVGTYGMIRHTTNGGKNWSTQTSPLAGTLNSVYFVDEDTGWIVSKDNWGEIAHTTNGGGTWIRQTAPTSNPLIDVFFIDADKGWIVGMDSTILRTTNGGQTWIRCDLDVTNNWFFRSVYFIDEMRGWTVGIYGIIMLTNDGGITWQEIKSGFSETLNSVYFIDPDNGWATGDAGTILRSIDGGYTWFEQYSGVARNFLTSVYFVNLRDGWVCGEGGTIKNTENGGFWNEPGTFLRNRLKLPVNDLAETRDTLTVDFSDMKNSGYQLVGLEVMIDSIMHTRASDLDIYLSHNGITETLVTQVTDPGPNFLWTRLTDEASKIITNGVAPFSGNHKPYRPLTAFNGIDPSGEWILKIYDGKATHSGTLNAWGIKPQFEKIVSVDEPILAEGDQKIQLLQNVPNPFTGITQIKWKSDLNGFTSLKVYNINGQEITTLMNKFLPKGDYSVQFDGSHLSSGVYYYQLKVGNYMLQKKCIIM